MQDINCDVLSKILTFSRGDHIFNASTSKQFREISNINESEFVSESRTLEQVKSVWDIKPSNEFVKKVIKLGKKDILEFMVSKGLTFDLKDINNAILESSLDVVEFILDNAPPADSMGWVYHTCYHGIREQSLDMVKLAIRKGCQPDDYVWYAFTENDVQSNMGGTIQYEQEMIETIWNNSSEHCEALDFIEMAARDGYVDFIKLLIFLKDDEEINIFEDIRRYATEAELFCNEHEMPFSEHERDIDVCHSFCGVVAWLDKNGL